MDQIDSPADPTPGASGAAPFMPVLPPVRAEEPGRPTERPDIRRFADYRQFLRAFVPFLRATKPTFSYRNFAKRAGFSSPNYLKLVTDGLRNLAPESADKFALGLGLAKREQDIFRLLVGLANARTDDERNALLGRLRERVMTDESARLREDQFAVYDLWWALVVREMATLPGFRLDADWIARQLRPRIRPREAQRALDLLLRVGLLVKTDDGSARPAEQTITTGPEVQALAVRNYHRAQLGLASQALEDIPREERNITSVAVVLNRAQYEEVIAEIGKARRRILEIADNPARAQADAPTSEIYQAIFSLFPVTQFGKNAGRKSDDSSDHGGEP
ncbi:MAG: TIGR02147 family protein [Myxococcota bacterium]